MKKPRYRLSPNEVEQLVKEERDRRRKLRIIQVREQAKASAANIRNDVRKEKERLLNQFSSQVEAQLTAEKEEKVRKLRQKYEGTLRGIGDGHREAHIQGDGYSAAEQLQRQQEAEEAAQDRYAAALKKQRLEDAAREHEQRRHIVARQAALEVERERATEIASLPPPAQDFCLEMDKKSRPAVRTTDMQTFASSHYHIPDYQVVRAGPHEQTDAKLEAEDTDLKLRQDLAEKKRSLHEQKERARIRGNEALQKEMLKHDLGDMIQDLSLLQRQDRRRRQKVLADVPKQVFIPPERCLEERRERQSEMERKFDELYMGQFKERGAAELQNIDISDYPTSQDSASDSFQESSETVNAIIPMSRINPALRDLTNVQPQAEKGKQPDSVLKQLLGKIRAQRDAPNSQASTDPQLVMKDRQPPKAVSARSGMTQDVDTVSAAASDKLDSVSADQPLAGNVNLSQYSQSMASPGFKGHGSHSDVDSETVAANDKMIEELMKRIKLIELQKQQLSRQFEAQSGALDSLLRPSRPDSRGGRSLEASSDFTLKEVTIESMTDMDGRSSVGHGMATAKDDPENIERRLRANVVAGDNSSPGLDLAAAMSKLRPVSGILKGVKNLQYELLTSNGFLPSPEFTGATGGTDADAEICEGSAVRDEDIGRVEVGGGGDAKLVRQAKLSDGSDGLYRDGNFAVGSARHFNEQYVVHDTEQSRGRRDSGDGPAMLVAGDEKGHNSSLLSSTSALMSGMMSEKVREYAEKAGERHAGLDEQTVRLVRDYQGQLLQKQSDRRNMLAQVRADIEARRRQLYTSKQSFLDDNMTNVFPAGGSGVNVGEVAAQKIDGSQIDCGFFGNAESARRVIATDPLEGRSGLLLSSWTSRQQERDKSSEPVGDPTFTVNSSQWEPIKPFIADPGRYHNQQRVFFNPSLVQADNQQQMSQQFRLDTDNQQQMYQPFPFDSEQDQVKKRDSVPDSTGSSTRETKPQDKRRKDKVRKSLSFEEKETETVNEAANTSRVSWKDVLNDTPSSERAWGTSEEEESSSPLLTRSHTSLDNSGRAGDKSSDKSSVITGSSSLNGSVLVARAEERRVGFERRQAELRQQLMDIQQQKDSILQRYQAGQEALHQQQAVLREKLLVAAAGGSQKQGETDVGGGRKGDKFVSVNTDLDARKGNKSAGDDTALEKEQTQTWAESLAQQSKQRSGVQILTQPTRARESISPTTATDASHSGRPSLASTSTPGNISTDSFLADISYHKLKSADQSNLPSSAFQTQPETSGKTTFSMPTKDIFAASSSQHKTWATLLQSSTGSLQSTAGVQDPQRTASSALTKTKLTTPGIVFPQKSVTPSPSSSGLDSPTSPQASAAPIFGSTTTTTTTTLADHQPHELSTIMEVDTPTSSSTMKHGQHQRHQRHLRDQFPGSESNSSQSLSSQASSTVHQGRTGTGSQTATSGIAPVIDSFPELPFTFSRPGTVFDLTAEGQLSSFSDRPTDRTGSARRSINFSKESSNTRQGYRVQPLVEKSNNDEEEEDDVDDEAEDLHSVPMPFLVGVMPTPAKSEPQHGRTKGADLSSDLSSLQISGYSEYLRSGTGVAYDETHATAKPLSEELAQAESLDQESRNIQTSEVMGEAEKFSPEVLQRLRQQSKDVFGDSATMIPERGEGEGLEDSAVSGAGDITLGDKSSLPSMDLAEISIQDTSEN